MADVTEQVRTALRNLEDLDQLNLSREVQLVLARSQNEDATEALAELPGLHVDAQEELANRTLWMTLQVLACREDLTPKSQQLLARDTDNDDHDRWRILAQREDLLEETLVTLAGCSDWRAPILLAQNPSITRAVILELAKRDDGDVDKALVGREDFYWDADLPVSLWLRYPRVLREEVAFGGYDAETVMALAPGWQQSLQDLYEASVLVSRSA